MQPVLEVKHLSKVFGGRRRTKTTAVEDVSFVLGAGECLGIVGESGSGKTTVADMIACLTAPTEGSVLLDGREITQRKGKELRQIYKEIQMVFQTPVESFDPRQKLGDGIGEGLKNQGMSGAAVRKEVERLLSLCGLPASYAERFPHQVSGGECQRAAIARAIAVRPRVLICDEATSALDAVIQREILLLLSDLKERLRLSILFICHDIALVQTFCDRMLVMHRGRIVEEGIPEEIIHRPKQAYTKKLVDSIL